MLSTGDPPICRTPPSSQNERTHRLNERWWAPSSFTLQCDGHAEETFTPEVVGNGYNYEAAEAGRRLGAGLLESDKLPHQLTLDVMQSMHALRAEWGLVVSGRGE
ncbi:MAG: hypothetical protein R2873_06670 [Caldilineaceae bacterium]